MTYTKSKRGYKRLTQDSPDFTFSPDGVTMLSRAGLEIDALCPTQYARIIQECYSKGWIKPVAYMRDTEYLLEVLR